MNNSDNERKNEAVSGEINESAAAKRLRLMGGMEEDREPESEIKVNKLENFWYHNKVTVIVVAIFVFIIGVAVVQYATRQNPDIYIIYAGPEYIAANDNRGFCNTVQSLMDDYNGDGKKLAQLNDFIFMSDNQLNKYMTELRENGEDPVFNPQINKQAAERFSYEIFGVNSTICILSEDQYKDVAEVGGFIPLKELLGETPENAHDEYSIRFADTKFCKFYKSVDIFPEDALIAIRRISTMSGFTGKEKAEERHAYHKELFIKILTFEYPEGYVETEE